VLQLVLLLLLLLLHPMQSHRLSHLHLAHRYQHLQQSGDLLSHGRACLPLSSLSVRGKVRVCACEGG
jgi:hypothetical protein